MSDLFLPAQRCERIYEYTMTGTAPAWFEPEALAFRQRILESIEGLSPLALAERPNREQVTHLSRRCLNLYPGTNIPGILPGTCACPGRKRTRGRPGRGGRAGVGPHHLQYEPERRIAQGSELYPGK